MAEEMDRNAKAAKSDDARVPIHLCSKWIPADYQGVDKERLEGALDQIGVAALIWWKRHLRREPAAFLERRYEKPK